MKYCYVLYVVSGKEEYVIRQLKKLLGCDLFSFFLPYMEKIFRKRGQTVKEQVLMFPGYIFIETDYPSDQFRLYMAEVMYQVSYVIRLLRYGESEEIALKESEKATLFSLCNHKYCVESSIGIIENDRVCIKEGPLKGMESKILKINRHKREAIVELWLMGDVRRVTISLEIVEKI